MYNNIIQNGLLISKWQDDEQRRELASMYLDYYKGVYRSVLGKLIEQQVNREGAKKLKYFMESVGLTEYIIKEIALVFSEPADITLLDAPDDVAADWDNTLSDVDVQVVLENIDQYVELLHDCAVMPIVIDGVAKLKIITPEKCIIHQKEDDPTEMIRFLYLVDTMVNTPGRLERVDIYACLDIADGRLRYYTCELDKLGQIIKETINEKEIPDYGRIPVVFFRNYLPTDCFWYSGNSTIVDTSIQADMRRTDLAMAEAYHIPQLVTSGLTNEEFKKLTLDRTSYINIPRDEMGNAQGKAEYITPDSGLDKLNEQIQNRRKTLARNKGLSSDTIDGVTATSGYQLALSKMDILQRNKSKRKYYIKPIRELMELLIDTLYFYDIINFTSYKDKVSIDFGEISFPQSEEEKARAREMNTAQGIWSPIQSIMQDNPDLDEKEAVKHFKKIQEWNKLGQPENPFEAEETEQTPA